jgi:hypothetical protein
MVLALASKLFARTPSLDDIVERAHRKLMDDVSIRLSARFAARG